MAKLSCSRTKEIRGVEPAPTLASGFPLCSAGFAGHGEDDDEDDLHETHIFAYEQVRFRSSHWGFMKLAVTIDVEEEGLFSGAYASGDVPVDNVPHLERLDGMFRRLGIRPTLLVTYPVARNAGHRLLLHRLAKAWGGEIGAHLHSWNTPPIMDSPHPMPVSSESLSAEQLDAKLRTLLDAVGAIDDVPPVSFRMGRFNLGSAMFAALERGGIKVDSSIAPMRREAGGPLWLDSPTDPYFPDPGHPHRQGSSPILEVPVTIVPVVPGLGRVLDRIADVGLATSVSWLASRLGCWSAQPMHTGLARLKHAARLHRRRGGEVITLHFHSSELMPGGCPRHRHEADVTRFLVKLEAFLDWLRKDMVDESLTLSEIGRRHRG